MEWKREAKRFLDSYFSSHLGRTGIFELQWVFQASDFELPHVYTDIRACHACRTEQTRGAEVYLALSFEISQCVMYASGVFWVFVCSLQEFLARTILMNKVATEIPYLSVFMTERLKSFFIHPFMFG